MIKELIEHKRTYPNKAVSDPELKVVLQWPEVGGEIVLKFSEIKRRRHSEFGSISIRLGAPQCGIAHFSVLVTESLPHSYMGIGFKGISGI